MNRRDFLASMAVTPASLSLAAAGDRIPDASEAAAKPMVITLLGTGTPAPSLTRQSSGYLLEVGTDLIVWDHGAGAHDRLIQSGVYNRWLVRRRPDDARCALPGTKRSRNLVSADSRSRVTERRLAGRIRRLS